MIWATAAFGGVRIISQFYFLAQTSATSLAISSLAIQALTIIIGIFAFGTELTLLLALGVSITIGMSALYAWLRTSKVLEKTPEVALQRRTSSQSNCTTMIECAGLRAADESPDEPPRAGSVRGRQRGCRTELTAQRE